MVEVPATLVAQKWADALAKDDARGAWRLMDPITRLALAQDWLEWGGPDLLAVKGRGHEGVVADLVSDNPQLTREFEALMSRLLHNWDNWFEVWGSSVVAIPAPCSSCPAMPEDVQEVMVTSVSGSSRVRLLMHRGDDGWRVASFGGHALPTPGSPPNLAGMVGAGQAPVGRYV